MLDPRLCHFLECCLDNATGAWRMYESVVSCMSNFADDLFLFCLIVNLFLPVFCGFLVVRVIDSSSEPSTLRSLRFPVNRGASNVERQTQQRRLWWMKFIIVVPWCAMVIQGGVVADESPGFLRTVWAAATPMVVVHMLREHEVCLGPGSFLFWRVVQLMTKQELLKTPSNPLRRSKFVLCGKGLLTATFITSTQLAPARRYRQVVNQPIALI